jgi:hypothetical protein
VVEWTARTASHNAPHARLRQQRSRLVRAVKPREPMPPGFEPLTAAAEALRHLGAIRAAMKDRPRTLERLEIAAETIRRLAWGPD